MKPTSRVEDDDGRAQDALECHLQKLTAADIRSQNYGRRQNIDLILPLPPTVHPCDFNKSLLHFM